MLRFYENSHAHNMGINITHKCMVKVVKWGSPHKVRVAFSYLYLMRAPICTASCHLSDTLSAILRECHHFVTLLGAFRSSSDVMVPSPIGGHSANSTKGPNEQKPFTQPMIVDRFRLLFGRKLLCATVVACKL